MKCLSRLLSWLTGTRPDVPKSDDHPIKHIILLMFENRSFDQMLGCFKSVYADLAGVDPTTPGSNKDSTGKEYFQQISSDPTVDPDPKHELEHILNQIKDGNGGFVSEYEREYPGTTEDQRQRVMDYFGLDDLPALHALARNFTICDHWFSSVPGPTWTNRFFAYSGTSKGIVDMPEGIGDTELYLHYDQDTIFDRLNEAGKKWRVYFGDVPNSLVLRHQLYPKNAIHYRQMHQFVNDVKGPEKVFPAFTLIEPNYLYGEQNDDHPPHSSVRAQRLLAHVYNTLQKNPDLWNSTLLVVVYDENGGFYDHVSPPKAVPPDEFQENYTFDRLGVRVPALLVSPWVDKGVLSTEFDHTSLLKYLSEIWGLPRLTERDANANSFLNVIRTDGPRTDTPKEVPMPDLADAERAAFATAEAAPLNENQRALLAFSEYLQGRAVPEAASVETRDIGPTTQSEIGRRRVEAFLARQTAIAGDVEELP